MGERVVVMEREAAWEVDGSRVRLPLNVAPGSIVLVPVGMKIEGKRREKKKTSR